MERSDIIEIVRQGMRYMEKAEQTRWRVMEFQKRYDETMAEIDKLRRRMVFVENGTSETLELVNAIMELEKLREEKRGAENRLKSFINVGLSYTLSAVELFTKDSTFIADHIALVLRQAVMLVRSNKELSIDFSCIYMQAVKTKIILNYTNDEENRMRYGNILRHLNQLINSIE